MTKAAAERALADVAALASAFLAATADTTPDASRDRLWGLLAEYRQHLAAVVAGL
ncbi:MAG TPA: hypothetical protein VII22_25325 [Streptosporangiaceae bacterium]